MAEARRVDKASKLLFSGLVVDERGLIYKRKKHIIENLLHARSCTLLYFSLVFKINL